MWLAGVALLAVTMLSPQGAKADCTTPAGVEADMYYNTTYKRVQFCDGTNWINMGVSFAGTVDNLGNHTATQTLVLGTNWLNGDSGAEGLSVSNLGAVQIDYSGPGNTYDVFLQGGSSATPGTGRRLALLGTEAGMLYLNYGAEYASGVTIGSHVAVNGTVKVNRPSDYWSNADIYRIAGHGQLDSHGAYEVTLTSNGYRNASDQWVSLGTNGSAGGSQLRLGPTGNIVFAADATKATGSAAALTPRMVIASSGAVSVPGTITAGAFVGDGSGLTGVSGSGDNLGDHTTTANIRLGAALTGNWLSGDGGNEGITVDANGRVRMDYTGTTYDIWLQGGPDAVAGTRNLALAGREDTDTLYLNFGSDYAGGVIIGGPITITAGALTDNSILTADIAPLAVTSAELAADAVTTAKIAPLNVTNAEIANATIVATTKLTATGTKNSTTFLRGDNTWAAPTAASPQGTWCGFATSGHSSMGGCSAFTSQATCSGSSVVSTCPTGYQSETYVITINSMCWRFCTKT